MYQGGKVGKGAQAMGDDDGADPEFDKLMKRHQDKLDTKQANKEKGNYKRAMKEKKYGNGGPKRGLKRNDHESWANGLSAKPSKGGGKGRGGKGGKPRKHHKGSQSRR